MSDRVKFWCNALRPGTDELNAAAGVVGTIVLILGVAGVVVPLVLHLSHWLIAVVLLSLLTLVVAEGSYHVWRVTDQKRKGAEDERDAVRAAARNKQAEVLDLQHAHLQQAAADRRRAQAARILIELERGSDLRVGQAEVAAGAIRGDIITADVTNTSDLPAYDPRLRWVDENGELLPISVNPEPLPNLMPYASETRTRRVPPGADPSRFFAVVRFRDANEVIWERDMSGGLKEIRAEVGPAAP